MKPVIIINTVTPKEGKMSEFLELQKEAQKKFAFVPDGWLGGRLHVSSDQKKVVMMVVFETKEQHQKWLTDADFLKHREKVLGLVESIEPGYFEIVAEAGRLQGWDF